MRRVLIFSLNYYPRFIGGAEVAIKEITDRIPHADIEFHMVTLRFDSMLPAVERMGNVVVHRIGFATKNPGIAALRRFPLHLNKHWYQIAAFLKATELHRTYRYDGIWAMMAHSCGIPAGLFKAFHPKVPYLLTLQEGDPPEAIEALMRPVMPLFRKGFASADVLQPISTFLLSWGQRMGFSGYAEVVPNAVDTARFARAWTDEERAEARRALGKKEGEVYLATTSRLVHKNAIDDVIRALPSMPPSVCFLVFGEGPDEEKLRALAGELGVEKRVRFMGLISHEDLPRTLSACDIFVRASRSEGMGNSFVEAMAAGLPVIATQEGGLTDFLFDSRRNPGVPATGYAVAKNTPAEIAAAVSRILEFPEESRKVVATAKALVLAKYDWGIVARDMRKLFDRLLAGRAIQ